MHAVQEVVGAALAFPNAKQVASVMVESPQLVAGPTWGVGAGDGIFVGLFVGLVVGALGAQVAVGLVVPGVR